MVLSKSQENEISRDRLAELLNEARGDRPAADAALAELIARDSDVMA